MVELPRLIHTRAIGMGLERELVFANRLRHSFGPGLVLLVSGPFHEYQRLLTFTATHPGSTIVCVGELARTLTKVRAGSDPNDRDSGELAHARSWLQQATTRGVRVEIARDAASTTRSCELLERSKAVLVSGAVGSDPSEMALFSAGLKGQGVFVTSRVPVARAEALVTQPGVLRSTFISTAGAAFEALLCEQKLSGLVALRRVG
jgi:hypothetical protein